MHNFDIFGEQIRLTYKGKDTFTTLPGTFLSLLILATILAFTIYRGFILINRINPDVSQQSFLRDLNFEEPFRPQDYGFDFAFGIGYPLDP